MTTVATIYVKLGLDAKDYHKGLGDATNSAKNFSSGLGGIMSGIGKVAAIGLGAVTLAAGAAAAALASTVKPASDLQESINALSVTFGDAKDTLLEYSKTAAETVGLSAREFNQLGTVTGAFLQNLGFTAAGAADETITLTERAADMASVFNKDVGTALGAIQSLLKGEFNPIEQFGVKINAAAVETYALEHGLIATKKELTDNIKAQAALALLYEQTEKTAGDFRNTSEGLANTQRRLAAHTENLKAKIGEALLPIVEKGANILVKLFDNPKVQNGINNLIDGIGKIGDWLGGLVDAFTETGDIFSSEFLESFTAFVPQEIQDKVFQLANSFQAFLGFLSNWWAINGPGITAAAQQMMGAIINGAQQAREKLEPFIQEVLGKFIAWFAENGPLIQEFAQKISDVFSNYIVPGIVGAIDLIGPLISSLVDIVLNVVTLIMQVATGDWTGAWETIKSIVSTAAEAVWKFILDAVDKILNLFGTSLPESVQIWRNNFDMLGQIAEHIKGRISDAIQGVIDWVDKMKSALANIKLPDWLTPGSPTPFEIGLVGIQHAMQGIARQALPELNANMQFAAAPIEGRSSAEDYFSSGSMTSAIDDASLERLARLIISAGQRNG